jgi:hypothetical protein
VLASLVELASGGLFRAGFFSLAIVFLVIAKRVYAICIAIPGSARNH